MKSENEGVETFADVMKKVEDFKCEGLINADRVKYIMSDLTRRFEAAHKREVAELKKKCEEYERQPELMAETAKSALELLKAQDSKIAELRECLESACEIYVRQNGCTPGRKDDAICAHDDCDQDGCPIKRWRKALEGVPK